MPHGYFNLLGSVYDYVFKPREPTELFDILGLNGNPQKKLRIIEVGGGTGRTLSYFNKFSDDLHLLEPAVNMLKVARDKYPFIKGKVGYAEDMPYADESFDIIIIYDSLHHWDKQAEGIQEVMRILKPGGKLLIGEIHPKHKVGFMVMEMERWLRMGSVFFTPRELKDLIRDAGGNILGSGWARRPTYYVLASK